jgi:N-acetylneuraminate synthase
LRAIGTLATAFGLPVGYSDHTLGCDVAVAAVACGAVIIEKHLTLDRARPGPDHAASLEPREFADLVTAIHSVEILLGDGCKVPQAAELKNTAIARKALVAAHPIAQGETITEQNLTVKRPAHGLAPIRYWDVLGQSARRAYQTDDFIEL